MNDREVYWAWGLVSEGLGSNSDYTIARSVPLSKWLRWLSKFQIPYVPKGDAILNL